MPQGSRKTSHTRSNLSTKVDFQFLKKTSVGGQSRVPSVESDLHARSPMLSTSGPAGPPRKAWNVLLLGARCPRGVHLPLQQAEGGSAEIAGQLLKAQWGGASSHFDTSGPLLGYRQSVQALLCCVVCCRFCPGLLLSTAGNHERGWG